MLFWQMHSNVRVATGAASHTADPPLLPCILHMDMETLKHDLLGQHLSPISSRSSQWLSLLCLKMMNILGDE